MPRLILASTSPYRAELLDRLRLDFDAVGSDVDESPIPGETPQERAQRLADLKAGAVAARFRATDTIVIGADQTAALDGTVLRKPGNPDTALAQLIACRGRSVFFYTAITVIDCRSGDAQRHLDTTEVRFSQLTDTDLERYIRLDEPFDCAGSFKAERLGAALFDAVVSRDPTALVGLPLIRVAGILRELGLDPLRHGVPSAETAGG